MIIIDTEKIETIDEAKELIIIGLSKLSEMEFDFLGLKETELFEIVPPDKKLYDFGIDLWDLIGEIQNQFPDEV